MLATLSFVSHYWTWILLGALGAAGIAYVSFVLRNWRLAAVALALVCAGLVGRALYANGYNSRVDEEVAAQTKQLKDRLDTLRDLSAADKQRADDDAAEIARLQEQAGATPADKRIALPRHAARRIGAVK